MPHAGHACAHQSPFTYARAQAPRRGAGDAHAHPQVDYSLATANFTKAGVLWVPPGVVLAIGPAGGEGGRVAGGVALPYLPGSWSGDSVLCDLLKHLESTPYMSASFLKESSDVLTALTWTAVEAVQVKTDNEEANGKERSVDGEAAEGCPSTGAASAAGASKHEDQLGLEHGQEDANGQE